MNVQQTVIDIIARTLEVPAETVTPETGIGDIEAWDSMGNVAILSAVESETGIDFPGDDLFELTSVAAIVEKIKALRNA